MNLQIDTLHLVNEVINIGLQTLKNNTNNPNLIKGIDNGIVGAFCSVVVGVVVRAIEKRKLKKRYAKQ